MHYSPAEKQLRISLMLLVYTNLFLDSETHMLPCEMLNTFYLPF